MLVDVNRAWQLTRTDRGSGAQRQVYSMIWSSLKPSSVVRLCTRSAWREALSVQEIEINERKTPAARNLFFTSLRVALARINTMKLSIALLGLSSRFKPRSYPS